MNKLLGLQRLLIKREELERAAELLNEKFNDMRRSAPRVEHNKLVIMVALQLTQEVLSLNKSLQEYAHCERLLQTILEDVEQIV